ncbi:MAG: hypothetical protein LBC75_00090 [Fibromonadaceae bacterium]|jgi:hypothetical protein|nr:hypothetical protein [Fibromonadaceae bacterium]
MNKKVKIATLVAFTVAFSVFSVKPAAAPPGLGKVMGDAIKSAEKATGKSADKLAEDALKAANKIAEPKGPIKEVRIVDIPSEYETNFASLVAGNLENSIDGCLPAWSYLQYNGQPDMIDSVMNGSVAAYAPCDNKKRLISIIFTKTKDENNSKGAGFTYAKGVGLDGCKSKATMPTYVLAEKQTFSFKDFIKNEDCNAVADKAEKDKKSKSKK